MLTLTFLLLSIFQATPLPVPSYIPMETEKATTPEACAWGLMGRRELKENGGMLFTFPSASKRSFWMFNCYLDLSVAFIDQAGVIREIYEMQAHPQWMDSKRPVLSLADLSRYPEDDPIYKAFYHARVFSKSKVKYALEMPKGWFTTHHIHPGDFLLIGEQGSDKIYPAMDLALLHSSQEESTLFHCSYTTYLPLFLSNPNLKAFVRFLDQDQQLITSGYLIGNTSTLDRFVLVPSRPASYIHIHWIY